MNSARQRTSGHGDSAQGISNGPQRGCPGCGSGKKDSQATAAMHRPKIAKGLALPAIPSNKGNRRYAANSTLIDQAGPLMLSLNPQP